MSKFTPKFIRKFKISTTVVYPPVVCGNQNGTIYRAWRKKKDIATTSLSSALSLAPTTPIYDAPVNMHPRRTILYRGWLLLTAAWRERRQSLMPLCWFSYDLYGPYDTWCKSVFLSSCRFRLCMTENRVSLIS